MKKPIFSQQSLALSIPATALICSLHLPLVASELRDLPHGVGNNVQPNILLLLDDSFSMQFEAIIPNEGNTPVGNNTRFGFLNGPLETAEDLLLACVDYNRLYYNPAVEYKPWSGVDVGGKPYTDYRKFDDPASIEFTRIPNNPYNGGVYYSHDDDEEVIDDNAPSIPFDNDVKALAYTMPASIRIDLVADQDTTVNPNGDGEFYGDGTTDLTETGISVIINDKTYYTGFGFVKSVGDKDKDDNPDNVFSNAECHYSGNNDTARRDSMLAQFELFRDMPKVPSDPDSNDGQEANHSIGNFANWFAYYRNRSYTAKAAIAEVLSESTARVGFATIHDVNHGAGIRDLTEGQNRENLMESVFQAFNYEFGTPSRRALYEAGRYFKEGEVPDSRLFGVRDFENDFLDKNTFDDDDDGDGYGEIPIQHEVNPGRAVVAEGVLEGAGSTVDNSPILNADHGGACQRNSTILFTDGAMWGDTMNLLGDALGDDKYPDPHDSPFSDTMADVGAFWADTDLSSSLENLVNVEDTIFKNNVLDHQHMTTYTVGFGFNASRDEIMDTDNPETWPDPNITTRGGNQNARELDAAHAASNSRGEFFSASTPDEISTALQETFRAAERVTGTASAVSFNSGSIGTDTQLFQATFSVDNWTGDIQAFEFTNNGVAERVWSAEAQLPAAADRNIFTYNSEEGRGVPFAWGSVQNPLSTDMIADLDIAGNGEDVLDFLAGDRGNELGNGGSFRNRDEGVLGPIIHSSPQYSGIPAERYPDAIGSATDLYSDFVESQEERIPLVFAGGNDGMLHAFNAGTTDDAGNIIDAGKEVFAYIPSMLENSLSALAQPNNTQQPYVDGTPTIRDVHIVDANTNANDSAWRTYLVGGLRKGGKGIYVLDVTDPSSFNADSIKFEISNADTGFEELGYTYSRPQISKLNNGRWAAIFGNGYHNESDGQAYLYVVDLATGELIKRFTAGTSGVLFNSDCADDESNCNGLSSPALADLNSDSVVDRVYAGDLHGNLWVFDLSDEDELNDSGDAAGEVLFTACVPGTLENDCKDDENLSVRQSITTVPALDFHRTRSSQDSDPNIVVYFGTGQLITTDDAFTTEEQAFYSVWDAGSENNPENIELVRDDLVAREFVFEDDVYNISGDVIDFNSVRGWYIDLVPTNATGFAGSRVVTSPIILGDIVFFVVNIPDSNFCQVNVSNSFLAALNLFDGTQSDQDIFNDGSTSALINLSNDDYTGDTVGVGTIDGDIIVNSDDGSTRLIDVSPKGFIPAGRKSWSILR